jgi:hypothetical protein
MLHARAEVGVVGDDQRYLGVELAGVPAPEKVYEAVVVAGDQDRHPLRRVGVRDAPVHLVLAGERRERGTKLVTLQPEAFALYLQPHEEGSTDAGTFVTNVLVGGEDVAVVHRDERGDRGYKPLLVRAGDKESDVIAHRWNTNFPYSV